MGGNGTLGLLAALLVADILLDKSVARQTKICIVLLTASVFVLAVIVSRYSV